MGGIELLVGLGFEPVKSNVFGSSVGANARVFDPELHGTVELTGIAGHFQALTEALGVGLPVERISRLGVDGGPAANTTGPFHVLIETLGVGLPVETLARLIDLANGGDASHTGPFEVLMEPLGVGLPVDTLARLGDLINGGAVANTGPVEVLMALLQVGLPVAILARLGDFVSGEATSKGGAATLVGNVFLVEAVVLAPLGVPATVEVNVAGDGEDQESVGMCVPILRTIVGDFCADQLVACDPSHQLYGWRFT